MAHHDTPLTYSEVAERLRVSERTVKRLVHDGRLPCVRIGARLVRVLPSQLNEYLTACSTVAAKGEMT